MTAKVGVGLRPTHYPYIQSNWPTEVDHFEVISENYMYSRGRPLETLLRIRERYPILAHGVSMSIMSADGVPEDYLEKLRDFYSLIEPKVCSDHLCWTGNAHNNIHDLLPFPFTKSFLELAITNISKVQDYLGRSMAFENLSAYISFGESNYSEWDFLVQACKTTGAKILLDLNNIWVNATNFKFDPQEYIDAIPLDIIAQIHLGGPTDTGKFLFDTHSTEVPEKVWHLLMTNSQRFSHIPVIVERDDEIPDFPMLLDELRHARQILVPSQRKTNASF